VLTRDPELDRRLRLFRSHGITREPALLEADPGPWHYEQQELGFNYRLTDLQCALGLSQLERLPERIRRRTELAGLYDRAFADRPELVRPPRAEGAASAWHLYVVQADFEGRGTTRAAVMERLASKGIGTQVHYIPVYRQPYYRRRWGDRRAEFPAAERYFERALSLPLHPSMSDDDAGRVAREFLAALGL
jgi:dTDP-4-amino-4,6-dideoxygalactose transaminase